MALRIGSLLAGRYEITAPIATGGMGEVWRARDRVAGPHRRRQGAPQRVHRRPELPGALPQRGPAHRRR